MKEHTHNYFADYSTHYQRMGNSSSANSWVRIDARDHYRPWMHALPTTARILDCGCGYGFTLQNLAWLGFTNLHGIELSPTIQVAAHHNLPESIPVEQADAFNWLPMHRNEFDAIIINDVLEHIPSAQTVDFLRLIHNALRSGGIVHIRVPNMGTLLAPYSMYLDSTHVTGFTDYSLMQALDLAGFSYHQVCSTRLPVHLWPVRPLKILKRLASNATYLLNTLTHRFFYFLRQQHPTPAYFGMNLEIWAQKK